MKKIKLSFVNKLVSSVSAFLFVLIFVSCNPRKAHVVGKLLHDMEHMSNETEAVSNDGQYEDNQQIVTTPAKELKYAISGIFQSENGTIERLRDNVVIETPQGLYLADGLGNPTAPVYENDKQVITETRIVRYSFDEDETELRPYNVSGYAYKSSNGLGTFYFNIGSRRN